MCKTQLVSPSAQGERRETIKTNVSRLLPAIISKLVESYSLLFLSISHRFLRIYHDDGDATRFFPPRLLVLSAYCFNVYLLLLLCTSIISHCHRVDLFYTTRGFNGKNSFCVRSDNCFTRARADLNIRTVAKIRYTISSSPLRVHCFFKLIIRSVEKRVCIRVLNIHGTKSFIVCYIPRHKSIYS